MAAVLAGELRKIGRSLPVAQLDHEQELWHRGVLYVAGVDEVGMGSLAGPVVAAAVILPPTSYQLSAISYQQTPTPALPEGVRDSKMLPAKRREGLDAEIRRAALGIGIGMVEVEEIDRINIYQAGLKAMRLAIESLPVMPEHVLVDGRIIPELPFAQTRFIKGDKTVYSIAAASIVAKVHRDKLMHALDAQYPQYGFARHMGYGTRIHREALSRFGPCPIHRRSFRLIKE
jgi:ribonuclease HII